MHHWCQWHRWPLEKKKLSFYLLLLNSQFTYIDWSFNFWFSLRCGQSDIVVPIHPGVIDTDSRRGQWPITAGVVDTGGKFTTGDLDPSGLLPPVSFAPVSKLPPVSLSSVQIWGQRQKWPPVSLPSPVNFPSVSTTPEVDLPLVLLSPLAHLDMRISLQIFVKTRNGAQELSGARGKMIHE